MLLGHFAAPKSLVFILAAFSYGGSWSLSLLPPQHPASHSCPSLTAELNHLFIVAST